MSSSQSPGILIVGAGPTGLTAALTLAKNGVPVRIIDKNATFSMEQRGSGIHPRTLELFNYLEVLPEVWKMGIPFKPFRHYKLPGGVETLATYYAVEPGEPTPSIPFINPWMIGQCHTQAILRKHLASYGTEVELSTECRNIEQHPDHVVVTTAKTEGGKETMASASYRWVIAADGGKSEIRKQLGISFDGQRLPERMILGEMEIKGLDGEHWHRWNDWSEKQKSTVVFRPTETPGRFWFMVGGNINYDGVLAGGRDVVMKTIRDCIERTDLEFGELFYMSDFQPSVRMVDKLADGRIFLAGDAAHIHSPLGGQGLNTSVQDAFNLSWKLALVERGVAPPSLLSSYSEERLPVIQRMIEETKTIFKIAMQAAQPRKPTAKTNDTKAPWSDWSEELKQLGVNYRWSSILVDERHGDDMEAKRGTIDAYGALGGDGLHAGDRAPNAPGLVDVKTSETTALFDIFRPVRHTFLIFSQDPDVVKDVLEAVKAYPAGLVRSVVVVPKDGAAIQADADLVLIDGDGHAYTGYGCSPGTSTIMIVRPDGVVGAIAAGVAGVKQYFSSIFSGH